MGERKYVLISLKHMTSVSKNLLFWGNGRTADNEARSFSGYTIDPSKMEIYSQEDLEKDNKWNTTNYPCIECENQITNVHKFFMEHKKEDTVSVDIEYLKDYVEEFRKAKYSKNIAHIKAFKEDLDNDFDEILFSLRELGWDGIISVCNENGKLEWSFPHCRADTLTFDQMLKYLEAQ